MRFVIVYILSFYFNDTATTEIYTYCHTLSLLDALPIFIARDWLVPGADEAAAAFVECYTDLWNRNRTIFVVRNLAAEEGDVRFYEARMKQARPMMDAISQQVERAQAAGRTPAQLSSRARKSVG